MLSFFTGLLLGAGHVVSGPDHLAAVAPLSTRSRAWRIGLSWGVGHAGGVALVALAIWSLGRALALDDLALHGERIVGLGLIAVGSWSVLARTGEERHIIHRGTSAFGVGIVHGVAGGSHLYAALPAVALEDGAVYLAGFGLGAVVTMASFAAVVGRLIAPTSPSTRTRVQRGLGMVTIAVGVGWLLI